MFSKADIEMGIVGAIGMGISIGVINSGTGLKMAVMAGGAQAVYSFSVISFTTWMCRRSLKVHPVFAVINPTIFTTLFTYLIHITIGSPEPLYSALFAFVIAIISFILQTIRFQHHGNEPVYSLLKKYFLVKKK